MKYLNDRGQEPNSDTHYYSSSGNNMRAECRIGTMANICHSYFVVEAKAHSKITSNIELSSARGVGGRVNKETTAAEREQHAQAPSLYYYVCPPFNGRDRRIIIVFPHDHHDLNSLFTAYYLPTTILGAVPENGRKGCGCPLGRVEDNFMRRKFPSILISASSKQSL